MGRKAWILTLAVLVLVAILVWAWIDGGLRQTSWIEEPIDLPARAG